MSDLGIRLKNLREKRKLGLTKIAKFVGVSPSTYRDWEYGREIKGEPYMKLAEIFNVSLTYLLTGEESDNGPAELDKLEELLQTALLHVKSIRLLR